MRLPVFELEKYFYKHEFKAPYILCGSDSESLLVKELVEMADEESLTLWENLHLGYTELSGAPVLRREIAKLYEQVDKKRGVLTFSGASEALFAAMNVLIRPEDHVIVPSPCYQSLQTLPKELGAEVSLLAMRERGGGWYFEIQDLEKLITPKTRLIIINFPHNPTSVHIDRSTLEQIVSYAKSVDAYLLSDEVYRFSEHRGESLPPAADLYEKAISVGVLSKTFGLAGLRLGWLASQDTDFLEECLDLKCYLSMCNSGPSEILALMALRAKDKIVTRNLNILRANVDLLDRFFQKYPQVFAWKRPMAGATAFPKLIASLSIGEFAEDLLAKEGVLLLPSSVYKFPGNYFRIGFGRKNMPHALELLEKFVKSRFRDRYQD